MINRSYNFTHAITRKPSVSIVDGLRAVDTGTPSLDIFKQHHEAYIDALASTGVTVITLDAADDFPDSVFVEDVALCLDRGAIILRPGAPSRLGEAALMAPILSELYEEVFQIGGSGFIEGGDILTTEKEILIGISARTNRAGIEELRNLVSQWGYLVREVETPEGVLHFKTDCSLLDEETILSTQRLDSSGCFENYNVIYTATGEEACANSVRFNDCVIMPSGFPYTRERLENAGYHTIEVGNSEAAKLDGGMSCLSLRFSPKVAR